MLTDKTFFKTERSIFWLLVLLYALPIWRWHYFLTIDGPTHLYNAWLLKTMVQAPQSVLHQWLAFNLNPEPNYLSHLLLGGLLTVLPPWLAEKLVQTAYVVGLPLALRYLLRSWQPAAGFLAILGFPLIYSVVFIFGFYNFCLSLVVLLLVLGYWRRHVAPATRSARAVWVLAGLVTVLYFSHPLSYLVSGLMLGLFIVEQVVRARRIAWVELGYSLLAVALAYLPTLPLLGLYFWNKGTATGQPAVSYRDNLKDWLSLAPIRHMTGNEGSYSFFHFNRPEWHLLPTAEVIYLQLVGLLVVVAALYVVWRGVRHASHGPALAWLLGTGLMVGAYIVLPDAISGGSIIRPRWGIFSYLLLIGSFTAVSYSPRARTVLLVAATTVASLLLTFRYAKYQAMQSALADYLSVAGHVQPRTSLLPFIYGQPTRMPDGQNYPSTYNMLSHAASYVSLERQLLNLENYEAETDYFPLLWRPGHLPLRQPNGTPARPSALLLAHPANYVSRWASNQASPTGSAIDKQLINAYLNQHYQLIYRSPAGLLELYARRK